MPLALGTASIFMLALLWALAMPSLRRLGQRLRDLRAQARAGTVLPSAYDPGRERRAEQRARSLLRSCVDEEEWAMYRDLGFLRRWGGSTDGCPYAYLIYPHKPLVAYVPQTGQLLNEYCVAFPDHTRPYGSARLPDSDDVLAKWLALTADERGLIADANMHLPGRQVDPVRVRRDLQRLSRWEAQRIAGEQRLGPPVTRLGTSSGIEASTGLGTSTDIEASTGLGTSTDIEASTGLGTSKGIGASTGAERSPALETSTGLHEGPEADGPGDPGIA